MRILHLSAFDSVGGAARAANRLHNGLIDNNIDSWMVVRRQTENSRNLIKCGGIGKINKGISMLRPYIDAVPLMFMRNKKNLPWTIAWLPNKYGRIQKEISPDITHIHWVGTGFLSLSNLRQVTSPTVWTLHDAWPFTGGCHIVNDCTEFKNKCGKCPQLGTGSSIDLSKIGWHRKHNLYKSFSPVFVAPSRWIAEQARSSTLLSNFRIEVIPNGLDSDVFQPIDKHLARKLLKLPQDKKLLLFGAMSATTDSNKGFNKLKNILKLLSQTNLRNQVELVVFGDSEPVKKPDLGFKTTYLGYFRDDISLAVIYSSADLMCVPSIQESFGQIATEAMSCGTPVVAFATSGLLDIVEHGVTGYLAKPYNEEAFVNYIVSLFNDSTRLSNMSKNSRNRVLENFDISRVSSKYVDLYKSILTGET